MLAVVAAGMIREQLLLWVELAAAVLVEKVAEAPRFQLMEQLILAVVVAAQDPPLMVQMAGQAL
jgi:hypothetical protein